MNLQNLVDYCEEFDLPSPFSGANVPEPLNLETVINAIMIRCGLLTPVYPEPDVFREMTRHWFDTKQWTFEHLIKVIQAEYSPIENVFEDRTETTTHGHTETRSGSYKDTTGGKDERDITNSGTDSTTNQISAYNSATYQPDNKSDTTHGHKVEDDVTYGRTSERIYNNDKMTHGGVDKLEVNRHGNIGVTTNQQMINEELELLRHFDIYSYIAKMFETDMMIMIY